MRFIQLTFFLIITAFLTNSYAQSLENVWKARGLEAQGNITKLNKKKSLTKEEECKKQIETSFADLAQETSVRITKESKGYSLFFKSNGLSSFSVDFIFTHTSTLPYMILPLFFEPNAKKNSKEWVFSIMTARPQGSFAISKNKCTFYFDMPDYLNPKIQVD